MRPTVVETTDQAVGANAASSSDTKRHFHFPVLMWVAHLTPYRACTMHGDRLDSHTTATYIYIQ